MSRASRGGLTLKSGKIGRVNCLRQQLLMPNERMNINLSGKVRLETLRERDVFRINAHLGVFMTPLRWLWSDYTDYVKDGSDGVYTIPSASSQNWSKYGIGAYNPTVSATTFHKFWEDAPLRVYNEWYKHPEDADATSWDDDGNKAVPLAKNWSRCRYDATPDDNADYEISVASDIDVRELAEKQARFRGAMKRDVLSYNRWIELIKDTWKGDGSRETDQVPIMIDQVEVGVNPRDMPATDGSGLGQWQSMYDFNVDHYIDGVVAPEHCILTYMLTVRFASVTEGRTPLGAESQWFDLLGDPEWISVAEPQRVLARDVFMTSSTTLLGYLPAGWQWRSDHDVIGARIDELNSFPYMNAPTTQTECKDATRIKNAFRSQRLGDYVADIYIKEESQQPIGTSMDSYMSGMLDHTRNIGNSGAEFPHGGKQL